MVHKLYEEPPMDANERELLLDASVDTKWDKS